ncbi:MAG: thioredoxin family protein [Muribaculaceae bacterium]|nr:thioredoxin family protein [Muribaculaceae bacterium]
MKKFILGTLALFVTSFCGNAQTEFRHITFDEAKEAAKAENKKIFIDFFTEWCGPCKRLAKLVFPQPEIGDYLNSNFVCLKLDAEKEGAELAQVYNVSAYPTLCVVDTDGTLLGSFAGAKEGKEFIAAVEACKNPDLKPEVVKERYEAGERTPQLIQTYAVQIIDSNRNYMQGLTESAAMVDDYFNSLSDADRLKDENIFMFTDSYFDYNSPRLKFMVENQKKFPADQQEKVKEMIDRIYTSAVVNYFTNNSLSGNSENQAKYNQFKKELKDLGLDKKNANMINFIDKRASSDDAAYLAYVDQNLSNLTDDEQGYFMSGITNLFTLDNDEQKKAVSSLIRKYIGSMSPSAMYSAAMAVYQLEAGH